MALKTVRTVADLRAQVAAWRASGKSVALTPTMGALHQGHLSLVELGHQRADCVVASIFVNPAQFGPNEDFDLYPRQEQADADLLESVGCDLLYAPGVREIYPDGFATRVHVARLGDRLCGAARPGHFDGVATVVSKLLLQAAPDVAIFGEKDFQQLAIIKTLARDLNIPAEILGAETVRESDGLALSSRNRYLSAAERQIAPALQQNLQKVAAGLRQGQPAPELCAAAEEDLLAAGFAKVDYVEVCDAETLTPIGQFIGAPTRVLAAAYLGKARLIDNIAV